MWFYLYSSFHVAKTNDKSKEKIKKSLSGLSHPPFLIPVQASHIYTQHKSRKSEIKNIPSPRIWLLNTPADLNLK